MKLLNVKRNKKRLDNKGFTLIELLAVIVILAIVMGISANSVLNSINQSRKSSLHSTAQNAANNLKNYIFAKEKPASSGLLFLYDFKRKTIK